jgi:hypothetical protein
MTIVPLEGIVTNENSRFKGMEGSDVWDMFIKQMDVSDLAISITDNRGLLSVMKVQKPGNTMPKVPKDFLQHLSMVIRDGRLVLQLALTILLLGIIKCKRSSAVCLLKKHYSVVLIA